MENINIPIYRAKVLGLDNNYIIGFYQQYIEGFENNIYHEINNTLIDPTTISINFNDMQDSQGNKIFASLNEDGKGGDIFECSIIFRKQENIFNGTFIYRNRMFTTDNYCVNQGFAKKFKVIGIQK